MKGKRFIVIIAIFLMLCSIQATTAFEDNNLNQTDDLIVDNVQFSDSIENSSNEQISDIGVPNNLTDVANIELSHFVDTSLGISIGSSNSVGVNSQNILGISGENLLEISNEDNLGITPGTFVYGVDFDSNRVGDSIIPLDRFFKAIYYGINDYMQRNPTATREWNVFLNNKTFIGDYGQGSVGAIETGFLSSTGSRVKYLTFNSLNNYRNIGLTIHLYGGRTIGDGLTSTLDLSGYSESFALLDFSVGDSSINGINFKNFNVNNHTGKTLDPNTRTPFIKLGDSNDLSNISNLITNCTFQNIVLNPNQPLYVLGETGEIHYKTDSQYKTGSLYSFMHFVFKTISEKMQKKINMREVPTTVWDVYLDNVTFTGQTVGLDTGYPPWDLANHARYLTFRGLFNYDVVVHLYGGYAKDDGLTSTLDLSNMRLLIFLWILVMVILLLATLKL